MNTIEASKELEKLLAMITDERLWDDLTDGEIAQAMRLKMMNDIRSSCWEIEGMITMYIVELKALQKIVTIRELIDKRLRQLGYPTE